MPKYHRFKKAGRNYILRLAVLSLNTFKFRRKYFDPEFFERLQLNTIEMRVLASLVYNGPSFHNKVAKDFGMHGAELRDIVARLEQQGFLIRNKRPKGRDFIKLEPTEVGCRHVLYIIDSIYEHIEPKLQKYYPEKELQMIHACLQAYRNIYARKASHACHIELGNGLQPWFY